MSFPRAVVPVLFALAAITLPALMAGSCAATPNPSTFNTGGGSPTSASSTTGTGGAGGSEILVDAGNSDGTGGVGGDPTTCAEAASTKTYIGCDFWPTVVANNVWSIFDFAVVVANAGSEPATVQVLRNGQAVQGAQIQPNGLATLYLPWVPELKGLDCDTCGNSMPLASTVRANGGAYHLVSTRPVAVYQFSALEYKGEGGPPGKNWGSCPGNQVCPAQFGPIGCFSFSNDASLLLPSTAMTGNYRVTGLRGWSGANMGAYFAVTGTQNGTTVVVTVGPKGYVVKGGGIPATSKNGKVTFSLDAGDVVEIVGNPVTDLSGSLVKASAPVQVITGAPCIQSPIGTPACDHVEESVFPAETLGRRYFVTVPTSPNGDVVGHVVRLYGNIDGTALHYPASLPANAPTVINAGQVVDLGVVSKDFEIKGDHEFAVASFMLGAQLVDPNSLPQKGDPSQSLTTAVEQYRTKYVFLAPSDYDVSFIDVVGPMGVKIILDGAVLAMSPTTIGSGFGVFRIKLGQGIGGAHVLNASAPVGMQVMGYGAYTSYQYPGGLNLQAIAPPPPK